MKRVTIYVDNDTWMRFRIACIKVGESASSIINKFMKDKTVELLESIGIGRAHV